MAQRIEETRSRSKSAPSKVEKTIGRARPKPDRRNRRGAPTHDLANAEFIEQQEYHALTAVWLESNSHEVNADAQK
jgi:hypothetical protein